MALTKTQIKQLETIRSNIRRAAQYLNRPEVAGIAITAPENRILGNTYIIKNVACCESCENTPAAINLANKNVGSDIAGLYTALSLIESFLNPPAPFFTEEMCSN